MYGLPAPPSSHPASPARDHRSIGVAYEPAPRYSEAPVMDSGCSFTSTVQSISAPVYSSFSSHSVVRDSFNNHYGRQSKPKYTEEYNYRVESPVICNDTRYGPLPQLNSLPYDESPGRMRALLSYETGRQ